MIVKDRNLNIDVAKGIGIICVSIYHFVFRYENSLSDKILCELIWLLMPLFFIISGYLDKNRKKSFSQKIFYRIKALLVPTLKYTVIWLLIGGIYCVIFHDYSSRDFFRDVIQTYLRPEFSNFVIPEWGVGGILFESLSAVWFIWSMMFTYFIFYHIADYVRYDSKKLIFTVLILLSLGIIVYDFGEKISWSLTVIPIYAALMLCGSYFAQIHDFKFNFLIAITAAVIHFVMYQFFGTDFVFANSLGTVGRWSVITFFLQTFIGIYAFMALCSALNKKTKLISKFFIYIGQNSLIFLVFHGAFGLIYSDVLHTFIKLSQEYWYIDNITPETFCKSLAVCFLSILSCFVICFLKDKFKEQK